MRLVLVLQRAIIDQVLSGFTTFILAMCLSTLANASFMVSDDRKQIAVVNNNGRLAVYDYEKETLIWSKGLGLKNTVGLGFFPESSKNFVIAVGHEKTSAPVLHSILWGKTVYSSKIFYGVSSARKLPETTASIFAMNGKRLALAESWAARIFLLNVLVFTEISPARVLSISDLIAQEISSHGHVVYNKNNYIHPSVVATLEYGDFADGDTWSELAECKKSGIIVGITKKGYLYGWDLRENSLNPPQRKFIARPKPIFIFNLRQRSGETYASSVDCGHDVIVSAVDSAMYGDIQVFNVGGKFLHNYELKGAKTEKHHTLKILARASPQTIILCNSNFFHILRLIEKTISMVGSLAKEHSTPCKLNNVSYIEKDMYGFYTQDGVIVFDMEAKSIVKSFGSTGKLIWSSAKKAP